MYGLFHGNFSSIHFIDDLSISSTGTFTILNYKVFCPKCSSEKYVKDGKVKGRQRYRCKSCGYRHTVQHRGKSPEIKRQALEMYLEGLGFSVYWPDFEMQSCGGL